jgi:hypothetical protein
MKSGAAHALEAGLRFLHASQQADGSFPTVRWLSDQGADVDFYYGEKTFFTTVFIGSVLLGVPGAETIVGRVTEFVEAHRERDWVWGYLTRDDPGARALPPDVDDTALSALLLRAAGRQVSAAEAVILSNRDREGRFYTWITALGAWWRSPARIRIAVRRLPDLPWIIRGFRHDPQRVRDLDAGVNANVVLHLGRRPETERAVDYLVDVARRGEIADRWYADPFTLWYMISRSLRRHDVEAGAVLLEHVASRSPATPLQIAEAVCIVDDWNGRVEEGWVASLVASQADDGSWARLPLYVARDLRWGSTSATTALCVEALSRRPE